MQTLVRRVLDAAVLGACAASAAAQIFDDRTANSGLQNVTLASAHEFGVGLCPGDFDGDSDLDLVVPQNIGEPMLYFRNDGALVFTDRTAHANLGISHDSLIATAADPDNDGDLDVYVGNLWQAPQLFVNDGTGRFTEEAAARGLVHVTSAWGASFGDYDRDGWLDLYVGNRIQQIGSSPEPNILYRNTGGGHFVDVTAAAGVAHAGATFVVVFFDHDEDGWPDILCVNDKGRNYGPNELYRNNRDGTFTAIGPAVGANDAIDGMGVDFLDAFADGGLDYFCSDLPPDHLFRVWDPAQQRFQNMTAPCGLQGGLIGWAVHFADFDNDRWPDLHVVHMNGPNYVFMNPALPLGPIATPWTRVIDAIAPATPQTSATVGDFDRDGRVDVVHRMLPPALGQSPPRSGVLLHRNILPVRHWLEVDTIGSVSNRDGIGARVEVTAGGVRQRQYVRSGIGFLSGNDLTLRFGLGDATSAFVRVVWPSGQEQVVPVIAADQRLTLHEPFFASSGAPRVGATTFLDLHAPDDAGLWFAILLAAYDTPGTPLPDGRVLPLRFDDLTAASLTPNNGVLGGNIGPLQGGLGRAQLAVPNVAGLAGLSFHASGLTFDPASLPLRTIFPRAVPLTIVP